MIQPRDTLAVYRYGAIFTPAFCAIIWWLARYSSAFGSVMSCPEWVLLGEASYTFYLFHSMGLDIVTNNHKALPGGFGDYFLMAAALALTGIFSVVLFIWFETPARHFLRGKLDPKKPAAPNPEISTPSPKPPAMV
jgi:peptidoglycan/LPS O-acetylase OafA/YrhL